MLKQTFFYNRNLQTSAEDVMTETKLNDVLNHTFAAIVSLRVFPNQDWEQEYISVGTSRIFGYTPQEFMADKFLWTSRVHPEDRENLILPLFTDFLTERTIQLDHRFYHKNGSLRWISSIYTSRRDEEADCWIVTVVSRDVTDYYRTEAALRDSEERYRSVITAIREGIVVHDASGKIITCNASAERILGLSKEEIIGRTSFDARWQTIHEDGSLFPSENHPTMVTLRTGTACINVVMGVYKPNGELSWVLINSQPLFQPGKTTPYAVVVSFSDISRRKEAEAALRKSELSYRTLAENLPAIVYRLYPAENNRMVFFNNMIETMFGYNSDDLCSEEVCSIESIIVAEDKAKIIAIRQDAIRKNQPFQIEYRLRNKNSEIRYCWEQGRPIKNADGNVLHIDGVIFDITERKVVEEALYQSNERLMLALETANMGSWDWDILKNEILWTPLHDNIFGHKPGTKKRSYTDWCNSVYPEDLPLAQEYLQAAMANHNAYQHQYRIIRPDNEVRWISAFGRFYYDSSDQPIRMVGMLYDITDQKLASEKIHEQAALLNIATDAICVRDLENRILFWNQGAENLYGFSAAEVLGKNANELFYRDTSVLEVAIKTTIESGSWHGELTQVRKDRTEVIVASSWTLMRGAGQPKSILIVNSDITEKKQLEAQFYRAQRLESLGTLASGIAHDLNNILTPILAISQLLPLKLTNLDAASIELLKIQESNAKRASELVKQILSFARGTESKRTIIQIKHLLLEIYRIARGTFPKSIEIETQIPDNLATVVADATQIHQILMNLIVNARDAMSNGGKLSIIANNFYADDNYAKMNIEAKVGNYILITIADTGVGICSENIDKIFEPFFTTKDVGKGTGLGLSTTIGIIKNHGGFINVFSELGLGSQFKVYLPASNSTIYQSLTNQELPPGKGELILVVDDENLITETTKYTLENYNYRVLKAIDGIDAIAIYAQRKNEISVVLIDMMMPVMDGENAIRTLQKINPKVQIIAMSGLASTAMIEKAAKHGVKNFLPKPFTAQELLISLHNIFSSE